ncbi:MAG: threonine ammonia-lyase [Promethearchaeota archaeon]|jgi:threonine dehydratase
MELKNIEPIKKARERIREYVRMTPLIRSEYLSKICKGNIFLKLENLQPTNSFKVRGAFNRLLQLNPEESKRGVVTASSGNHAQGVALAAEKLNISAKIVVPTNVSMAKLSKIKKYDVEIIQEGDFDSVERKAREVAVKENIIYISPYNDLEVINGQGTITLEIYEDLADVDSIIAPIGGGGLISGIALAAKSLDSSIEIIGVQTSGASTMYQSWKAGKIVVVEEFQTIAEGLLGGLEAGALTFELIKEYVDHIILVDELSVKKAINLLWKKEGQIVEGAGAVSVGYILEEKEKFAQKNVVAIISGGNIENSLFKKIIKKIKKD